jgi:hypothetical protein
MQYNREIGSSEDNRPRLTANAFTVSWTLLFPSESCAVTDRAKVWYETQLPLPTDRHQFKNTERFGSCSKDCDLYCRGGHFSFQPRRLLSCHGGFALQLLTNCGTAIKLGADHFFPHRLFCIQPNRLKKGWNCVREALGSNHGHTSYFNWDFSWFSCIT